MAHYDVFISCKSEDYKYAEEIYDYLKELGINVFLASRELRLMGESEYRRAISDALKEAYHIIIFASDPEYIVSRWVEYEWDMFVNAKLKGKKQGNIMTILKDVSTDDIPMDLWKYESFTFDNYRQNLLKYVETPDSIERKKELQRKKEEEEKKRKEEEAKALRRKELKSKLEATAGEYKKSVATLQVDADKINGILKDLGITHRECPICHTSLTLKEKACTTCGWPISPIEGLQELSYLKSDFDGSKAKYSDIFKASLKIGQYSESISGLNIRNSELENNIKKYTSEIKELEAEVSKQQIIIEELHQKIEQLESSNEKNNAYLKKSVVENMSSSLHQGSEEEFEDPVSTEADDCVGNGNDAESHTTSCATPKIEIIEKYVEETSSEPVTEEAVTISEAVDAQTVYSEDEVVASATEELSDSNGHGETSDNEEFHPVWSEDATTDQRMIITEILNNMVKVEGGKMELGATEEQLKWAKKNEYPPHLVELSSYWIGKFTVTQREWEAITDGDASLYRESKLPKTKISLKDCRDFVRKLRDISGINFALPTEAQWEFAARGGVKSERFIYSGSNSLKDVGCCFTSGGLHEVGLLKSNELGLYDMSGNVYEWCDEKYGEYTADNVKNPHNIYTKVGFWSSGEFIARGGSYLSARKYCRVSTRVHHIETQVLYDLGLRLVINP